jgi:hypothetical protein
VTAWEWIADVIVPAHTLHYCAAIRGGQRYDERWPTRPHGAIRCAIIAGYVSDRYGWVVP